MKIGISNEWGPLERVMVGHGKRMGAPPTLQTAYDPTSKQHLKAGTFPSALEVAKQLDHLALRLEKEGVEVIRPLDVPDLEQVFARDVGMVIDDVFIQSRMIEDRRAEWDGIAPLLEKTPVHHLPDLAKLEGGDVLVLDHALAVGSRPTPLWLHCKLHEPIRRAWTF